MQGALCHFEQSEKSEYVHRRGNPLWLPDSSLRCVACVGTHKGMPECSVRHISGQTHRSAPTVRGDLTSIVWGRNEYSMEPKAIYSTTFISTPTMPPSHPIYVDIYNACVRTYKLKSFNLCMRTRCIHFRVYRRLGGKPIFNLPTP